MLATIRACILPTSLGGTELGFTPTGSIHSPIHERSRTKRATLLPRLRHILFDCGAWFHCLVALTLVFALVFRISIIVNAQTNSEALVIDLLRYIAWPPLSCLTGIDGHLLPLRYAIFPPDVPERNELMETKNGDAVRYPTEVAKKLKWSSWMEERAHLTTLIAVYSLVLLTISWWL
jgi:hypothetical protein